MTDRRPLLVTVGHADADIVGSNHRALQSAVDYVAGLGGGVVRVEAGRYEMRDSLHLRSNVVLESRGAVLAKADAASSPLVIDGDYGEEQITLADPTGFHVGDGVSVGDDASGGFHHVVATLLWQDGSTFGVSKPMNGDYLVSRNARAATTFPVISGYHVEGVSISGFEIQGNRGNNEYLTGCRGAGIFLYRSHGTRIRDCRVLDYAGDGISFQQSHGVTVEDCLSEGNTHLGLHPGSGSGSPEIRRCRSQKNGQTGLFLCWRVKHGVFEDNQLLDNGRTGISIGHKDTDNLFTRNTIRGNGREGILFRDESEPMAGHRNRFIGNDVVGNGSAEDGCGVRILGHTHDLVFEQNRITDDESGVQTIALYVGSHAETPRLDENEVAGAIVDETEQVDA
ncbi:MAG: hypothetical protein CME26_11070 [Gemmatimonadetes bacterium]|nr:hypothetical protein [Gemmatimonadota bacterium]